MEARSLLRHLIPYGIRIEVTRARRMPAFLLERGRMALHKCRGPEASRFAYPLESHRSPLDRSPGSVDAVLQRGKEANVTIAARRIDSIVIEPGQTFSYHHAVGRPSRLRGFRPGLELHDGALSRGIGGGCCMVSNLLYLLALRSGMTIVERHRHALDLFPDHGRAVPFGCGATVFYNMADLRFRNDLAFPVLLSLKVDGGCLSGEFRSPGRPPFTVEVYEVEHHFERTAGGWVRENRLRRRVVADDGSTLCDEEIAHNVARVLYNPEEV